MNNKETDKPMGHSYDGIEELDNPLPRWWLYGFYLTIVFAGLYTAFYWAGPGLTLAQVYDARVLALKSQKKPDAAGFNLALLTTIRSDTQLRTSTATLFTERCAACHGELGQGVIGPNLTDAYWLHGGSPDQVLKTIRVGVGDKGMPAWGESMSPDESANLAAYILSLKGTQAAKEPQGELAKE